ncbi:5922_t:CDS:2 [Racocetra fulgida]|uniref:5922_t:CDS:1 n=1 Tax=Racocetra fulgida TaxID=60492 RepID=A0A9N9A6U6_9GLOM|nr:5922_t:CDS:2 [Racocetra fulgida]
MVPSAIRTHHNFIVNTNSNSNRTSTSTLASSLSTSSVISPRPFDNTDTIAKNTVGQKNAIAKIKEATQQISECEQAIKLITAASSNFRAAEDIVDCDLSDYEIPNLHNV